MSEANNEMNVQDLEAREAALVLRETRANAADMLRERGLPLGLLDALDCRDAERCQATLTAVETAFRAAVQQEVLHRMRGAPPDRGEPEPDLDSMDDAAYYAHILKRRN